jgi:hypothetical protein
MKQSIYSILILVVLVFSSCEKFLEKEPLDFLSPSNYFETEADLTSALAGTYDILGNVYGGVWLYRAGIEADEGWFARNSPAIGPQNFNFSSSFGDVTNIWSTLFRGINRANILLENVDKNTSIAESFRNRIKGEALFLRGYYYFLLVQSYGGVPIFTKSTASVKDIDAARNSIAEVYNQVLADMTAAENLVPDITAIGHAGRVSKSAVRGILARVCLNMAGEPLKDVSKYAEARTWAKKVIDDTQAAHSLNPDYSNIFIKIARDEYDIKESIFEVEFWGNRTDVYTETGFVGFANGPQTSNVETGNGFGGLRVTAKLYRKYNANDLRRDWCIANFTYNNSGPSGSKTLITGTVTDANLYNRQAAKFRREYETLIPKAVGQTPQNFPLLRFSDVLLMYAEAENEINNNPTPSAFEAINQVRRRAFGKLLPGAINVNQYDLNSSLDYDDFKSELQDERMRELAFEQLRKSDLIRWGIFAFEMNVVLQNIDQNFTARPYYRIRFLNAQESKHVLWPIPAGDIVLNKLLTQNPGW